MPSIIDLLSAVGRPIVDQSGLQDRYDIDASELHQPDNNSFVPAGAMIVSLE
jgi:hypothetical protein